MTDLNQTDLNGAGLRKTGLGWSGLGETLARTRWAVGSSLRVLGLGLRRVLRVLVPFGRIRLTRFLFAPPDLRTTDPTVAADIYAGQFVFAGRVVAVGGKSPFDVPAPTSSWAEALYGFGWLRHLQAANSSLARDNARTLISDFNARTRRLPAVALQPHVMARRLMALLAQSSLVLDGASHEFYGMFLGLVRHEARLLRDARHLSDDPTVRLVSAVALTTLGLCVEGAERLEKHFGRELSDQLDEQILADGGHVSRNPRVLVDLMLDLLPVRSTYAARGLEAPRGLVTAIDRVVPHLKMLRHPDGSIALFNGMGASQVDALATIFASHDTGGRAATEAPYSGYHRLEAGGAVLIADTGPSPPFAVSADALAGCLAFEFSHQRQRIFINCGVPRQAGPELPVELRATAAHSATTLSDMSSCQFISRRGETRILKGPRRVTATRTTTPEGESIALSHDGYVARFGLTLQRSFLLHSDGQALSGVDSVTGTVAGLPDGGVRTIRFHLHPSLQAGRTAQGDVLMTPARGSSWLFRCEGAHVSLEDSVFFSGNEGARRTSQIVLVTASLTEPVSWQLARLPQDDLAPV